MKCKMLVLFIHFLSWSISLAAREPVGRMRRSTVSEPNAFSEGLTRLHKAIWPHYIQEYCTEARKKAQNMAQTRMSAKKHKQSYGLLSRD